MYLVEIEFYRPSLRFQIFAVLSVKGSCTRLFKIKNQKLYSEIVKKRFKKSIERNCGRFQHPPRSMCLYFSVSRHRCVLVLRLTAEPV